MKSSSVLIRTALGAISLATLLIAPSGCAGVDESAEAVGQAAEALNTPVLVASPSSINFGTVAHGSRGVTLTVQLNNTGDGAASSITLAVPPDPCHVVLNPPSNLAGGGYGTMQINFAPAAAGTFSGTLNVSYRAPSGSTLGTLYTLSIPYSGSAS